MRISTSIQVAALALTGVTACSSSGGPSQAATLAAQGCSADRADTTYVAGTMASSGTADGGSPSLTPCLTLTGPRTSRGAPRTSG